MLVALPLNAVAATAQGVRTSITTFDKQGKGTTYATSDENRPSFATFDKDGVPIINYTSPPPANNTAQNPPSIAGLLANQNLYGQSAPNPNPNNYTRFGNANSPIYPPGYYPYPAQGYGYPVYPAPAYPVQNPPYTIQFQEPNLPWAVTGSITNIPLTPSYAYPAPVYPAPYAVPTYPYPAPTYNYGYPVPAYPYGYGYGNGYGNGTYTNNTTGYGISFGRGGFSASIGGSNTSSRSTTTTTIITR